MGSYALALQQSEGLKDTERKQEIAKHQDASMNIAGILRAGKHPDTGAPLSPAEIAELSRQNGLIAARIHDLFNPRQDPSKLGKNESQASGVAQPEGVVRRLADKLHVTKPRVSAPQTTDATVPAMTLPGSNGTVPAGPKKTVQGPPKTAAEQLRDLEAITQKYQSLPGQKEAQTARTQLDSKIQSIHESTDLTKEEKSDAIRKLYGVGDKPVMKEFKLPNGLFQWFDVSRPDEVPEGATAVEGGQTADTRKRSDYENWKEGHPEWTGTFEQWAKQQGTIAALKFDANTGQAINPQTGKRYSRHDANLPPEVASLFADQKETAAEKQQNAMALMYARGRAMGAGRFVQVIDGDGGVTYMNVGDAAKAGAQSPAGIAFQIDKAMEKSLTSGNLGQNIIAFKTAAAHLDLLQEAADALNNGDTQFINRTANEFNQAFGSPAPSNFDAVKAAVVGELGRTFKNSVTDTELENIKATINNAQSPAQIAGAIGYYRTLMNSKVTAVQQMGQSVRQGLKNSVDKGSKGNRSLKAAMALPGNKGKTKQQVMDDLKTHGYTPIDDVK